MTADDVRARFEITDEDVEASGAAYFDGPWDILPPRSKAIYRNAIRRALATYAKRHADLSGEVREAVERIDAALELAEPQHTVFIGNKAAWRTIRAHLLAREAEVERLQNIADGNAELYQHELLRTERAEALLRECRLMLPAHCGALEASITAHLSENSRG